MMSENKEQLTNAVSEQADRKAENKAQRAGGSERKREKKGKRRRRKRIAVSLALLTACVALALGVIVGFLIGNSVSSRKLRDAQAIIDEQAAQLGLLSGEDLPYDEYDAQQNAENAAALSELSDMGEGSSELASVLVGEIGFEGAQQGEAVVVATYSGGELLSDDVARAYSEEYAGFMFEGYSAQDVSGELLSSVMHDLIGERVLEAHAREMGLYELTDEDRAQIERTAQEDYDALLEFTKGMIDVGGMSLAEADGAAKVFLRDNAGITLESVLSELRESWWKRKLQNALTADIELDDTELRSAYEERLAQQKELFSANPGDFEFAQISGESVLYNLPGYRRVQLLYFSLGSFDAAAQVSELNAQRAELDRKDDAQLIEQLDAQLDRLYMDAEIRANAALSQLEEGSTFETLLTELGDDAGMKDAATREAGYYLSASTQIWGESLAAAAMALQNPGDISAPVRTDEGVYIVRYLGELPQGTVELKDVRDTFRAQLLEEHREEAYYAQLEAWIEEAQPVYYPERMQ